MIKNPLVSIITPTYNHSKFIGECIESVKAQTYKNWEMIIINDGSSDGTLEIAKKYAEVDSRIHVFDQENIGIFRLVETYNKALNISKGEFIAILEGDDLWMEDKLQKQLDIFKSYPEIVLCFSQASCISSDKGKIHYVFPEINTSEMQFYNNKPIGDIINIFLFKNCIPALTLLIRKESLLKINGFKQSHNLPLVDLPTLYQLAITGPFYFIPKSTGMWRVYANQITKTFPHTITEGFLNLALDFYNLNDLNKIVEIEVSKADICKYYNKSLIVNYSRAGRYKLIRHKFKEARKDYLKSIFGFGFYKIDWKIRSIIGILFSYFHLNIEGLAKFLGKNSYKIN